MTELRIVDPRVVESLGDKFVEPTTSLPEKYRILFSLRNIAGEKAHDAMLLGTFVCLMDCDNVLLHKMAIIIQKCSFFPRK
jgi:hypothetical protein